MVSDGWVVDGDGDGNGNRGDEDGGNIDDSCSYSSSPIFYYLYYFIKKF